MIQKPLLIFNKLAKAQKSRLSGFSGDFFKPDAEQQAQRLTQRISQLDSVFQNQTAYFANNPAYLVSEMILVFEIAGTIENFFGAVKRTQGMEFLAEFRSEFAPDEYFASMDANGNRLQSNLESRLFLTMTNHAALRELQSYWGRYQRGEPFLRNTNKFLALFQQLKDIRPYSIADRIRDTGLLEDINDLKQQGEQTYHFEIELAYKSSHQKNIAAYREVEILIVQNGGDVISQSRTIISEIGYHAFIARAPIHSFDDISESTSVTFLKSQQILFFRPVGQSIHRIESDFEGIPIESENSMPSAEGFPIVALLDGYPLSNHSVLQGRLIVDDPDEFGQSYLAKSRNHGTAMASLIIHGDLSTSDHTPLRRPLYVRPIMKGHPDGKEYLPLDRLPVDLIHRAVRRMLGGNMDEPPSASGVRIINFSIGDINRPFHKNISTWAKLIDWLSYKYNVLFIVSAGNVHRNIAINVKSKEFDNLTEGDKQKRMVEAIVSENYNRKILTPAESINSLTVGSNHKDDATLGQFPERLNLLYTPSVMAPFSRVGFGYNGSVKPELLMPGGRKLFRKPHIQPDPDKTLLRMEDDHLKYPPGNLVAIVGTSGTLNNTGYTCGTSNSTALTTRLAAQLYEMLIALNADINNTNKIRTDYFPVIIKCLLVHGASWGDAQTILKDAVLQSPSVTSRTAKKNVFPYLGFGSLDSEKVLYCTEHRVTLIGFGALAKDKAHEYAFPLPPSIAQQAIEKKLVISLAWFSPLNFNTGKYRQAHLYFDNMKDKGLLTLDRSEYDFKVGQKGTVQHDILEGSFADTFIDGDNVIIKVTCRQDAPGLSTRTEVPYAICATLEINDKIATNIYDEVKQRLKQPIQPRVQSRTQNREPINPNSSS